MSFFVVFVLIRSITCCFECFVVSVDVRRCLNVFCFSFFLSVCKLLTVPSSFVIIFSSSFVTDIHFQKHFRLIASWNHVITWHHLSWSYFKQLVKIVADNLSQRGLQSASTSNYILLRLLTKFDKQVFYARPAAWNCVPRDVGDSRCTFVNTQTVSLCHTPFSFIDFYVQCIAPLFFVIVINRCTAVNWRMIIVTIPGKFFVNL